MNQLLSTAALAACAFGLQLSSEGLLSDAQSPFDVSSVTVSADEYSARYPDFENELRKHEHSTADYEAIEVTTVDRYILTTFFIHANPDVEYQGAIMFQHGYGENGIIWMAHSTAQKPAHLQLADAGYDVFVANNRGTEPSQKHHMFEADGDSAYEYWDFTYLDMAKDVEANIQVIKELTGEEKIIFIAYSQGTAQMHYALAKEGSTLHESLKRYIAMAPCFIMRLNIPDNWYDNQIAKFRSVGVNALYGPNWEQDIGTICENFGITCPFFRFAHFSSATSVKSLEHWMQNDLVNEWREHVQGWVTEDEVNGVNKGTVIDPSKIQGVPMSFIVATWDSICGYDDAKKHIALMNTEVDPITNVTPDKTWIDANLSNHFYFSDTGKDWLMNQLWKELAK